MSSPIWPINVLSPPTGTAMVGDSNYTNAGGTDDAPALQAMVTAATGSGGVPAIFIPGGRTYRIGSTIQITKPIIIQGGGGNSEVGTAGAPYLVWSGAVNGTMFDVAFAAQNIPSVIFENFCLTGRTDTTNMPGTLIKYRGTGGNTGSVDTGTILRNVWLADCTRDALRIEGGATNFLIENGRFDNWGRDLTVSGNPALSGYGIYVTGGGASITLAGQLTMANPYASNGGIFLDGESGGSSAMKSVVKIYGLHPEIASLNETYSGGAKTYDKRGWFRVGVNSAVTDVQHHIFVAGLQVDAPFSIPSFSVFQITATSTADSDLDNTRMVHLTVEQGRGLSRGTDETDTDGLDEMRLLGGRVFTNDRPPQVVANVGYFHLGLGKYSTGGDIASFITSHNYRLKFPIMHPTTIAQLPLAATAWPKAGMRGYVTDCTLTYSSANLAAGVGAGGGSNFVPVYYDGSNWRIG